MVTNAAMPDRSRAWAALLLVLTVSPALADAPGWVLYTHPDKLMSLRFPGKPKESEQERKVPHGTLRVKIAAFTDGERGFTSTVEVYRTGTKLKVTETYNGIFAWRTRTRLVLRRRDGSCPAVCPSPLCVRFNPDSTIGSS
jgi:hypothetical protein